MAHAVVLLIEPIRLHDGISLTFSFKLLLGENRVDIIIPRLEKFCDDFQENENRRISTQFNSQNRFDMDVAIDQTQ